MQLKNKEWNIIKMRKKFSLAGSDYKKKVQIILILAFIISISTPILKIPINSKEQWKENKSQIFISA